MCKSASLFFGLLAFLFAVVTAGCSGGTGTASSRAVTLNPSGSQVLVQGQSLGVHANENVRWSLSGVGSLSDESMTSVTYHAPKTGATPAHASVTATSVTDSNHFASLKVTVGLLSPVHVDTTSLPSAVVGIFYTTTLKASGGDGNYAWTVSGGSLPSWAGLNPEAGIITGTPDTTGTSNFSVKATDGVGGNSTSQALSLVVAEGPLISTKSLPDGNVGVPYATELVADGGLPPYTWSVSSGSLPDWATLDSGTGLISGTPDAERDASFTIEASDSQSPRGTAVQSLSLHVGTPATDNSTELRGQYAFLLQGFDEATGEQFAVVGSFDSDGNGKITGGLEDSNGPAGYKPAFSFSGTYSVGSDNRGFAHFTDSSGHTTTLALSVGSLNSSRVATKASLIEFDANTSRLLGSGFVYRQDTGSFNLSNLQGPYAFQMVGQTNQPASRMVVTGAYTMDGHGNLTNGDEEVNNNGSAEERTFTGTFSTASSTSSFGRVALQVLANGESSHSIIYLIGGDHALGMTTGAESTSGLLSGEVRSQSSKSFSDASLAGTSVGYSEGNSALSIGRWNFDNSDNATYTFISGHADGINYNVYYPQSGTITYSVRTNGRVTTEGSLASGVLQGAIFYLVGTNEGFVMSTDSSAAGGFFEPQTGGPFSNASLSGNYMLGTIPPPVAGSKVESGELTSPGDGTFKMTFSTSDSGGILDSGQKMSELILVYPEGLGIDGEFLPDFSYMISPKKAISVWETGGWPIIMVIQR